MKMEVSQMEKIREEMKAQLEALVSEKRKLELELSDVVNFKQVIAQMKYQNPQSVGEYFVLVPKLEHETLNREVQQLKDSLSRMEVKMTA